MVREAHPYWDSVSAAEVEYTAQVAERLKGLEWARPLLDHARIRGSLPEQKHNATAPTSENLSDLFELRFADELARSGAVAEYEFAAGVDQSTVDFRVTQPAEWLIELVSLRTTEAVKESTSECEFAPGAQMFGHLLASDVISKGNSLQEEMVTAEGKIAGKAFDHGKPTKFPLPDGVYHVIIADMRGFGGEGGEDYEYVQMSVGVSALQGEEQDFALCLPGTRKPIKGLFEPTDPLPAANTVRERVHILGLVAEKAYQEGEITRSLLLVNNPFLFSGANAVLSAFEAFPLKGAPIHRPVVLPA